MTTAAHVATAVAPLKAEAVQRAEQDATALIAKMVAKLEAADWNLDTVAPQPNSRTMGRNEYIQARNYRSRFDAITQWFDPKTGKVPASRSSREPTIVRMNPERVAHFIETAKIEAGLQYDAFVAKLVQKVGEVTAASLTGSHVWGRSTLTVTKLDGSVERWNTQQIVNISVLGKLFNQWPTRKAK